MGAGSRWSWGAVSGSGSETQFLKEIFKILTVMYENNFQS